MSISGFKFFGYVDIVFDVIFCMVWVENVVGVVDCVFIDFVVFYDCIYCNVYVFYLVEVVKYVEYINIFCGFGNKVLNYIVWIVGVFNVIGSM